MGLAKCLSVHRIRLISKSHNYCTCTHTYIKKFANTFLTSFRDKINTFFFAIKHFAMFNEKIPTIIMNVIFVI